MGKIMATDERVLRQVPVPGHGTQICAGAPPKSYIQTGALALALSLKGG